MHNKSKFFIGLSVLLIAALLTGCAGMMTTPTKQNFNTPEVTLDRIEVVHYWGWWYFSSKVQPTAGEAGNYGAPLDLAFVFNVENPNRYPVKMENMKFTVAFEEFDLYTAISPETQWIPAGKTNQVRVHAMFDGRQSLLSLLVAGGLQLKEKTGDAGPGAALKQLGTWWQKIPEFAFPVHVKDGSAIFTADGITEVSAFSAAYP